MAEQIVTVEVIDAMSRVMGWQYLVRYSGMSPEWMSEVLSALASAALGVTVVDEVQP